MTNSNSNNPGNFANDREKASEAGKKGGKVSGGNFADDREKPPRRDARVAKTATVAAVNRQPQGGPLRASFLFSSYLHISRRATQREPRR